MNQTEATKWKILDRDTIKYFAMLAMLLNHISTIFMESGRFLSELFLDLGYVTAVTMCYFLVEGYYYTRSKKKYGLRLLLFALLSELPYCLAFTEDGILEFYGLNMMFTLFLCFCILFSVEKIENVVWKEAAVFICVVLSLFSDWALLAPVFTLLFMRAGNSRQKTKEAFAISAALFGLLEFAGGAGQFSPGMNLLYAVGGMAGIVLAGILILCFYNGKQSSRGRRFSKWFCYWFYPVHLLVLGLLRVWLG